MKTEKVCTVTGCKAKMGGWIDMALHNTPDHDYARVRFCREHYRQIIKKVKEQIDKERKSGKLSDNQNYLVVPPHITRKVLKVTA